MTDVFQVRTFALYGLTSIPVTMELPPFTQEELING